MDTGPEIARGASLFLGLYTLAGLLVSLVNPDLDLNLWWIDLRAVPTFVSGTALILLSASMIHFGFGCLRKVWFRRASAALTVCFAIWTAANAAMVWRLEASRTIQMGVWVPISCLMTVLLLWIAHAMVSQSATRRGRSFRIAASFLACACAFPVVQVFGFGKTDYQRRADVAVVFGARVYADGRLSDAVSDRVTTAVSLYQRGMVRRLFMSGGQGDGAFHEAEAMKLRAVQLGVPAEAILIDLHGVNTAATVRNTPRRAGMRVIAVSEFYHLPRIKMTYAASGIDVATLPARPRHWARNWPVKNIVREIPAFWVYLGRAAMHRV
jgi:uncharacterized SAM-binding protein YcdF (DUF218 family)